MTRVSFLFPGSTDYEALDNWVRTLARHCKAFKVELARVPTDCFRTGAGVFPNPDGEIALVLTETRSYPVERIDRDLAALKSLGIPFGVVHNHDNPGVPTPGDYPSFAWTQTALDRLSAKYCDKVVGNSFPVILLRQPVLPFVMEPKARPLHIGTFGHCEPKKATVEMALWARKNKLPFTVFCPDALVTQYDSYIKFVRTIGAEVVVHPWMDKIENLAPLFENISHFLFVLPPAKGGSGGSPTSPRYATAFARPVIVIDDEKTFEEDHFYVFKSLDTICDLEMSMPIVEWSPERYIGELVRLVKEYWRK